jgi:hypothetical protein
MEKLLRRMVISKCSQDLGGTFQTRIVSLLASASASLLVGGHEMGRFFEF